MKYGETTSVLKPLEELTLPDPRISWEPLFQSFDDSAKVLEIHERINKYAGLHSGVPKRVKSQFEIARNLMLYTYFVFEFQTQAELQAYATLEFALRVRFNHPKREVKRGKKTEFKPVMLKGLLQMAVDEKLIQPERLPSFEWTNEKLKFRAEQMGHEFEPISSNEWLKFVQTHIKEQRDHLAHGNPHLDLPFSFDQIERCADIINALYSNPDEKDSTAK